MERIDMAGLSVGDWRVIKYDTSKLGYWVCECVCGAAHSVRGVLLRHGKSRGCRACSGKRISEKKRQDKVVLRCSNPECGKVIERHPHRLRRTRQHFCSLACCWYRPYTRKEYVNNLYKKRYSEDVRYRLKYSVRNRIRKVIDRAQCSKRTQEIIGCDYDFLKSWLEWQFYPGMSWRNYGEWHIDHKTPLASADTVSETIALCHYSNLQPLWGRDNILKGARNG
jgi:hypothetical protein